MEYRQVLTISGKGSGPEQFAQALRGIAVDSPGLVYAAGDSSIKVFNNLGELQRSWSTDRPAQCVAVRADGTVFVGEPGQLEMFDAAGNRIDLWQDEERLRLVTAIGFYGDFVLVADSGDRCIRRFDKTGQWQNNIGKDNRTKGFMIPNGRLDFSVDDKGTIHAANPAKHRIERYSMEGELLGFFGRFGTRRPGDFPGCCNPSNITLAANGDVVVTEKANPRVKLYTGAGEFRAVVASQEFDPVCKNMDVAIDSQNRIYVVDTVQLRIHVFAPLSESEGVEPKGSTQTNEEVSQP